MRAIAIITDQSWVKTYSELSVQGMKMADMPSANRVWGAYLKNHNFECIPLVNSCPDCYTVEDFCKDHQKGKFVLGTGTHVIAVIDGNYYDAWDSGNEIPSYYWRTL